jgi:hypothetical protein
LIDDYLSSRGVFPVMLTQAGIQLLQQNISGFPPARLCRNWQNYSYWFFRHSGLDPWFDRLTTLSKVEGESSSFSKSYVNGCRSKIPSLAGIESGMTGRN